MEYIHWYPGHIAKAERKLKELLNLVDVVIEVRDARIPSSSAYPDIKRLIGDKPRLILLNKSDLTESKITKKWAEKIEKETECQVILTCASVQNDLKTITDKASMLAQEKISKLVQKGLLPRPARVMIVGMPNVGKSSIINKLIKRTKTKTGAKAGVTRTQQWVRINPKIDLLDTPGIIPFKQDNQESACRLAYVNSIGENAYEVEPVALKFIKDVEMNYPELIKEHYNLDENEESTLENIALKRNWIVSGQQPDTKRTASNILLDFRSGRLGKITIDRYEE